MSVYRNEFEQPIGFPIDDWQPRKHPPKAVMNGTFCTVEPINVVKHSRSLFEANLKAEDGRYWTYLAYGPFASLADYARWMKESCLGSDPGVASYLRIQPEVGVIEVGHINFAPELQRTPAATEAMYLMMKHVFEALGYRRYEWKCDDLNESSKKAAVLPYLPSPSTDKQEPRM